MVTCTCTLYIGCCLQHGLTINLRMESFALKLSSNSAFQCLTGCIPMVPTEAEFQMEFGFFP